MAGSFVGGGPLVAPNARRRWGPREPQRLAVPKRAYWPNLYDTVIPYVAGMPA